MQAIGVVSRLLQHVAGEAVRKRTRLASCRWVWQVSPACLAEGRDAGASYRRIQRAAATQCRGRSSAQAHPSGQLQVGLAGRRKLAQVWALRSELEDETQAPGQQEWPRCMAAALCKMVHCEPSRLFLCLMLHCQLPLRHESIWVC